MISMGFLYWLGAILFITLCVTCYVFLDAGKMKDTYSALVGKVKAERQTLSNQKDALIRERLELARLQRETEYERSNLEGERKKLDQEKIIHEAKVRQLAETAERLNQKDISLQLKERMLEKGSKKK